MSFENASVTKALIVGSALTSILAGMFDVKHYFHIQFVPHISRHHQYWRLFVHHLAFSNSSDLFLGVVILYNVGVQIERQFGSVKFASFALVSIMVSTLLELVSLMLFHRVGLNFMSLGPSALIFSILYQYSRIVPPVYNYRIFGIPLSNKSLNYVLALQMAISRLPGSAAVAIIGILTGQLYRSDLAGFKSYRIPPYVVRFSTNYLLPLIGSLRAPRRSNRALPDGATTLEVPFQNEEVITTARTPAASPSGTRNITSPDNAASNPTVMQEWVDTLTGRGERANAGIRAPSEAEIVQVTSMFPDIDRAVVIGALQRSPNIEGAVETLLLTQR